MFLKSMGWTLVIGAVLMGIPWYIFSAGRSSIADLARKNGLCQAENCDDGVATIEALSLEHYRASPGLTEWCFGVEKIGAAKVYRGGLFKAILVDTLYVPCSRFIGDDLGRKT